jgi:DNA-binding IclR family transcriptional regulator
VLPLGVGSAGRVLAGADAGSWVQTVEEREPGVASVSAAVVDGDCRLVAAVSVSGPVERLSRTPGRRYGARVVAAAAEIGARLAGAA